MIINRLTSDTSSHYTANLLQSCKSLYFFVWKVQKATSLSLSLPPLFTFHLFVPRLFSSPYSSSNLCVIHEQTLYWAGLCSRSHLSNTPLCCASIDAVGRVGICPWIFPEQHRLFGTKRFPPPPTILLPLSVVIATAQVRENELDFY